MGRFLEHYRPFWTLNNHRYVRNDTIYTFFLCEYARVYNIFPMFSHLEDKFAGAGTVLEQRVGGHNLREGEDLPNQRPQTAHLHQISYVSQALQIFRYKNTYIVISPEGLKRPVASLPRWTEPVFSEDSTADEAGPPTNLMCLHRVFTTYVVFFG